MESDAAFGALHDGDDEAVPLGLRRYDGPPGAGTIVVPLLIRAWTFDRLLPGGPWLGRHLVSGHRDVLAGSAGTLEDRFAGVEFTAREQVERTLTRPRPSRPSCRRP